MQIEEMTYGHPLWDRTMAFAETCSWHAGRYLAKKMRENGFEPNERVLAALCGENLAGFCTLTNLDELPPESGLGPFIGFVFVAKAHRVRRSSEKLIDAACEAAKMQGFSTIYLMSGEIGLYEKYGFQKMGEYETIYHTTDQLFSRAI